MLGIVEVYQLVSVIVTCALLGMAGSYACTAPGFRVLGIGFGVQAWFLVMFRRVRRNSSIDGFMINLVVNVILLLEMSLSIRQFGLVKQSEQSCLRIRII